MRKVLVPGDIVMFAFVAVYHLLRLEASQYLECWNTVYYKKMKKYLTVSVHTQKVPFDKIHLAIEIKIFINTP